MAPGSPCNVPNTDQMVLGVTDLLERSAANKDRYNKERLDSYYRCDAEQLDRDVHPR